MKLKTILSAVFAIVLLTCCTIDISGRKQYNGGVNNGDDSKATVKKTVSISSFDEIQAMNGIRIIFTQGKFTGKADIATTPSAEKYLVVEVKDKELSAYYKSHTGNIQGPTIIRVQAPVLEEISLTSAASVEVNGPLNIAKALDIELSSASSVKLNDVSGGELEIGLSSASSVSAGNLNLKKLDITQSSASTTNIGIVTANELEVGCSSASQSTIAGFKGGNADITASSGANVTVTGINAGKVEAAASSGGNVTVEGSCRSFSEMSSSGGSVKTRRMSSSQSRSSSSSSKSMKKKQTRTRSTSTTSSSEKILPREP